MNYTKVNFNLLIVLISSLFLMLISPVYLQAQGVTTIAYSNINTGNCFFPEGVEPAAKVNCLFTLTGGTSYNLPNSISISISGSSETSGSCFIIGSNLICNAIPTTGITNSASKNVNFIINNSGSSTKATINVLSSFGPWTPSSLFTPNAVSQIYFPGTNKIYQSIRGNDNKLYTRSSESVESFSNWDIGTSTITVKSQPIMAVFGSLLYQAAWGTDNGLYVRNFDGTTWTSWRSSAGVGLQGKPNLIVFDDKLWISIWGVDNRVYTRTILNDAVTWGNWVEGAGITTQSETSFAVGADGFLHEVGFGTDDAIYVRKYAAGGIAPTYQTTPTNWNTHGNITLGSRPILISNFSNKVITLARGSDNGFYIDSDLTSSSNWERIGNLAISATPDAVVFNGILTISARGTDNGIYQANNPYNPETITHQLAKGFEPFAQPWKKTTTITALNYPISTVFNSKLYQVTRGTDNRVWTRIRS
jgi:hypothetical protein